MKRSIGVVAVLAVCAAGLAGTALAEKFHYPTSDGGCAEGDTNSLSGGPYNHGNFWPAGGWGACLHVVNSGHLLHSVLRDPHTGDVIGTVTTPASGKTASGKPVRAARAAQAGDSGPDCKPGQDKGCVLRPSRPIP